MAVIIQKRFHYKTLPSFRNNLSIILKFLSFIVEETRQF